MMHILKSNEYDAQFKKVMNMMHSLKSNEYDAYNTMEKFNPYNSTHKIKRVQCKEEDISNDTYTCIDYNAYIVQKNKEYSLKLTLPR